MGSGGGDDDGLGWTTAVSSDDVLSRRERLAVDGWGDERVSAPSPRGRGLSTRARKLLAVVMVSAAAAGAAYGIGSSKDGLPSMGADAGASVQVLQSRDPDLSDFVSSTAPPAGMRSADHRGSAGSAQVASVRFAESRDPVLSDILPSVSSARSPSPGAGASERLDRQSVSHSSARVGAQSVESRDSDRSDRSPASSVTQSAERSSSSPVASMLERFGELSSMRYENTVEGQAALHDAVGKFVRSVDRVRGD